MHMEAQDAAQDHEQHQEAWGGAGRHHSNRALAAGVRALAFQGVRDLGLWDTIGQSGLLTGNHSQGHHLSCTFTDCPGARPTVSRSASLLS